MSLGRLKLLRSEQDLDILHKEIQNTEDSRLADMTTRL